MEDPLNSSFLSLALSLGCLAAPSLSGQPAPKAAPPRPSASLQTPTQLTPPGCGEVLHNFPRTLNLKWTPVVGADYYVVEIDCFGAHQMGHWDSEFNLAFKGGIAATTLTYNGFPGDNKGRWRVQAVKRGTPNTPYTESQWSKWCDFSFQSATQPRPAKPSLKPIIKITRIECGDKAGNPLGVRIAVSINSPSGISQWHVWSTWGGSNQVEKTFSGPLPTHVEEVVGLLHFNPDPVDRKHQWGLSVSVPGFDQPFRVYAFEPGPEQRCKGHYQPIPATTRDVRIRNTKS